MRSRISMAFLAAVLLSSPVAAEPGDMPVSEFLAKAEALKRRGILAMMSGDLQTLNREFRAADERHHAEAAADRAAKRPPTSCEPSKASMTVDQLLTHLRSYPPEVRPRTTITTALSDYIRLHFPCG